MAVKYQESTGTLGVARAASSEEMQPAFRQRACLAHSEVARNKIAGEAAFTL